MSAKLVTQLPLYFDEQVSGTLYPAANGGLRFEYAATWLANLDAQPLAPTLPLRSGLQDGEQVAAYFGHLLPTGKARQQLASQAGVAEHDLFALLALTAGDCAGAAQVTFADLQSNQPPHNQREASTSYQTLSEQDAQELVAFLPQRTMLTGTDPQLRLSLAGTQPKLPIRYGVTGEESVLQLPRGIAASTHILKIADPHYPYMVVNEVYCTRLAKHCGLVVPDITLLRLGDTPEQVVSIAERFDRKVTADQQVQQVQRLQQCNFSQAMGILPKQYLPLSSEAATLRDCRNLIDTEILLPAVARKRVLEWVMFNLLIGNANAGADKLALLMDQHGNQQLAPFYGLASTDIYQGSTEKFAMAIGGQRDVRYLFPVHRQKLLEDLDVTGRLARQVAAKLQKSMQKYAVELANSDLFNSEEQTVTQRIADDIQRRLIRLDGF